MPATKQHAGRSSPLKTGVRSAIIVWLVYHAKGQTEMKKKLIALTTVLLALCLTAQIALAAPEAPL